MFVTPHPRLGCVLSMSSPASSLCADGKKCTWGPPEQLTDPSPPCQSISALNLDVGRNTSESSPPCSCWPSCLLLWKRPRRPRLEGWSGSAGTGTWSPVWGRSRAGWCLALAASWTSISYSGTKSWPGSITRGDCWFLVCFFTRGSAEKTKRCLVPASVSVPERPPAPRALVKRGTASAGNDGWALGAANWNKSCAVCGSSCLSR